MSPYPSRGRGGGLHHDPFFVLFIPYNLLLLHLTWFVLEGGGGGGVCIELNYSPMIQKRGAELTARERRIARQRNHITNLGAAAARDF